MKRKTGTETAARPFALFVGLLAVLVFMHCGPSHVHHQDQPGTSRTIAAAAIGADDVGLHHSHGHGEGHDHGQGCCQASASTPQSRLAGGAWSQLERPLPAPAIAESAGPVPDLGAVELLHAAAFPPTADRAALMIWRI